MGESHVFRLQCLTSGAQKVRELFSIHNLHPPLPPEGEQGIGNPWITAAWMLTRARRTLEERVAGRHPLSTKGNT
jgi:hypothetical protein